MFVSIVLCVLAMSGQYTRGVDDLWGYGNKLG